MRQILFTIPLPEWLQSLLPTQEPLHGIPIYGYGMMLMFAFILCHVLSRRMSKKEGIDPNLMLDLIIWLFVSGIMGARIVYVIQYWNQQFAGASLFKIIALWDGGLVFYGSIFGGAAGYFAYHCLYMSKPYVSHWKMMDVIAPCIPLGLALGRIGCLFTGCCYGNVACTESPAIHFPLASAGAQKMIALGQQTPLGFSLREGSLEVEAVEPGLAAAAAGLRHGDVIEKINGNAEIKPADFARASGPIKLTVDRGGAKEEVDFEPTSIGLNPTQIYETISMTLLLFFLLSYYPYKRHDGELMVFLMFGYGVHRFLNEMLRTDTDPVAFNLTLSQNISIGVITCGIVLAFLVWRRPPIGNASPPVTLSETPPSQQTTAASA